MPLMWLPADALLLLFVAQSNNESACSAQLYLWPLFGTAAIALQRPTDINYFTHISPQLAWPVAEIN